METPLVLTELDILMLAFEDMYGKACVEVLRAWGTDKFDASINTANAVRDLFNIVTPALIEGN